MNQRQLGPVLLSGLMIGPVLGSGIILLPPVAYRQIGQFAMAAWLIMMGLGAVFAAIFAKLSLVFPGSEGVSVAVRKAFGPSVGQVASNYIISAVCVGPVAVLMTASDMIARTFLLPPQWLPLISGGLLFLCLVMLLREITAVGKIAFVASSAVAVILLVGSGVTIAIDHAPAMTGGAFEPVRFGHTLLLLFWAIVGWEILGNYSAEVRTPRKTIPRAAILSVAVISGIYLLVACAIERTGLPGGDVTVADIITPLLGRYSTVILAGITTALCTCTYLMIAGGIARLIHSLASDGRLPSGLAYRNRNSAPGAAIFLLAGMHLVVLLLLSLGMIRLEQVIAFANVFFLSNALLCIAAAMRLLDSALLRVGGGMLCAGFMILLLFSDPWIIGLMIGETLVTLRRGGRKPLHGVGRSLHSQ
ncbi:amino acid permease [Desulfonema ishimotonii]|uniref:Amino acid permease n=1 Tax=Desulfonema ishimotonii TaxID=45657 RepID=A0A401FXE5_9BACT|nr:amino acid permease [Desulfonema ishimotonii]GBC61640.1 amino acid permease [Desulfonema ishimotonii]